MGVTINGASAGDPVALRNRPLVVANHLDNAGAFQLIDNANGLTLAQATRGGDPRRAHRESASRSCMSKAAKQNRNVCR
jgi:hypothetical protein